VQQLRERTDLHVVGDVVVPEVTPTFDIVNKGLAFHPRRDTWRARAYFNGSRWRRRSIDAARKLCELPEHDVRLHVYPVSCALPTDRPYVVLTDNTMAVTQRCFRRWADLPKRRAAAAVERERLVLRRAAYVATLSTQARASAIDDYGCDPDRVIRVDGGTSLPNPRAIDRPPGLEVLFVATSFWRKGGETLLAAWRSVTASVPRAHLTIAGPRHRPPSDLPESAAWLGRQTPDQLRALYTRANVFVLPTLFESSVPNVIREAMAFNLPVVASDVAAIALDAPDGVVLFPVGNAEALAAAIVELLENPARAVALGGQLAAAAAERYAWSRLADAIAAMVIQSVGP
jgi:glycosyltransferase involved in cell wall biosynthesis